MFWSKPEIFWTWAVSFFSLSATPNKPSLRASWCALALFSAAAILASASWLNRCRDVLAMAFCSICAVSCACKDCIWSFAYLASDRSCSTETLNWENSSVNIWIFCLYESSRASACSRSLCNISCDCLSCCSMACWVLASVFSNVTSWWSNSSLSFSVAIARVLSYSLSMLSIAAWYSVSLFCIASWICTVVSYRSSNDGTSKLRLSSSSLHIFKSASVSSSSRSRL
jgi:hypothetical protein